MTFVFADRAVPMVAAAGFTAFAGGAATQSSARLMGAGH
jgi:hypothetical protein